MRHSWKVLFASAAAGGLAVGMSLASLPAGMLSAAKVAPHHAPTRAQVTAMLRNMTAPNKPAPMPRGLAPQVVSAGTVGAGSYNWSGYAAMNSTPQYFTRVAGSWTVPAVKCTPEDRLVSNWVGLDGAADSTVEQTGTTSWCFQGVAYYYSWYEMYPTGTVEVGSSVKPGDKITASVLRKGTTYTLRLTDTTTAGNTVAATATCALTFCLDESAEWVTERPAYPIGIVPLAQFSALRFAAASATGGGVKGPITAFGTAVDFTMVDATDTYALDQTSTLNATKNGFGNKWLNSY